MSSDDDYYADRYDYRYDTRSSKRPRRRPSSPRRHRHFDYDCFPRKNRRSKAVDNYFAPRLAGAIILLIFIVYEVVVLKGTSSSETTQSNQLERSQTSKTSPSPVNTNSYATAPVQVPVSHPTVVENKADSPEKAPSPTTAMPLSKSTVADSKHSASNPQQDQSPERPLEKDTASPVLVKTESSPVYASKSTTSSHIPTAPKSNSPHLPESAIRMESKGADEDPDVEPRNVRKQKSSHAGIDSTYMSSSSDATLPKSAQSGDKAAEPGAGDNFWNWFQETKGSDKKSVSKSLPCPEENKRLCQMFYKYIRKYKIRKIFDVSCEKNVEWMGGVLKKAGNELWGLKYYCSLWNGKNAEDVRRRLGGLPFVEFDDAKWWRAGFAADTELLFAWDTLAHVAYGRVWNFFVKAKKQEIKYILVDNYPGILNDPVSALARYLQDNGSIYSTDFLSTQNFAKSKSPKRDYLNLRKHPFRFPSAKEVAQNVTEPGETAKRQLLFYEISMLPDNLQ